MKKLTKEDILKGMDAREILHIDEYDADVIIRPLSDGELTEIISIIGNVAFKSDGTVDVSKTDVTKNLEAVRVAASKGIVEPKLSIEDLKNMKFGVPEFIGMKVLEISGVAPVPEVKKK